MIHFHSCSQCLNPLEAEYGHQLCAFCLAMDYLKDAVSGLDTCADCATMPVPSWHNLPSGIGLDPDSELNPVQMQQHKQFASHKCPRTSTTDTYISRVSESISRHMDDLKAPVAHLKFMIQELMWKLMSFMSFIHSSSPSLG